jgi:MFS family permease
VVTDRVERRRVMIAADLLRALAVAVIGILSVTGALELWHLVVIAAVFGSGEAFFGPAFSSIVPQIVPRELLLQANALDQFVRPLGFMLLGPALGGLIVATLGPGEAFLLDAATFGVSALALALLRPRPLAPREDPGSLLRDLREGFTFVRTRPWLWATLVAAAIFLLAYWGPIDVLVPFRVRNELAGGADDYGLILAFGGLGSITAAALVGRRGAPGRELTFAYFVWGFGSLALVGLGLGTAVWQLMGFMFLESALFTAGIVVWGTLMQTHVPNALLGRVSSLDWFVSTSLVPISFALTGPVSGVLGVQTTLVLAGVVACSVTLLFLYVPGVRDPERGRSEW